MFHHILLYQNCNGIRQNSESVQNEQTCFEYFLVNNSVYFYVEILMNFTDDCKFLFIRSYISYMEI